MTLCTMLVVPDRLHVATARVGPVAIHTLQAHRLPVRPEDAVGLQMRLVVEVQSPGVLQLLELRVLAGKRGDVPEAQTLFAPDAVVLQVGVAGGAMPVGNAGQLGSAAVFAVA